MTQEQILEIIQNNYNEYKGSNEAELHSSEEIYDLFFTNNRQQLIDFFMFFRDNGEKMLGSTIEQLVDSFLEQSTTKEKYKEKITYSRLLGEFVGVLKGIVHNDIPEDLKKKLETKIKELKLIKHDTI